MPLSYLGVPGFESWCWLLAPASHWYSPWEAAGMAQGPAFLQLTWEIPCVPDSWRWLSPSSCHHRCSVKAGKKVFTVCTSWFLEGHQLASTSCSVVGAGKIYVYVFRVWMRGKELSLCLSNDLRKGKRRREKKGKYWWHKGVCSVLSCFFQSAWWVRCGQKVINK